MLGNVYLRQFEMDKARDLFLDVLARDRAYRPALEAMVRLYLQQKKYNDLISLLSGYLKNSPTNPQILILQSKVWEAMGDGNKRIASLEDAVKYAPESPDVLRLYLLALVEEKQYAKALLKIKDVSAHQSMEWTEPIRARALAGNNRSTDSDAAFLAVYKKATGPMFEFVMDQAIKTYPDKKVLLSKLVDWAKSRPNDMPAFYFLGNIADDAGDFDLAEQTFNQMAKLAKTPADKLQITGLLGSTYYQRHEQNRSEKDYLAKAEKCFLDVIKESPKDVKSLNNLAYLYVDDYNDPAKAMPYAELAAKIQPDSNVLDTYGWILANQADRQANSQDRQNGLDQAKGILERSVQLDSATANRYHLGWVYEKVGRSEEALKLYRQVFENVRDKKTDPLYEPIKKAVERLGR
jgi:tetratricopeptide (TPR) repeat protein